MNKPKVLVIVGATASGKTSLAINVALTLNGEVISADSRQVYRGLNIGTAKVTETEMQGIPHHLIDIRDISESYSAADFAVDAAEIIETLTTKDKLPIIAGGTFFYIDTLLNRSITPAVEPNPELRAYLEELSPAMLFDELSRLDPVRANTIDRNNKRRLVRALEIVHELGSVPPATPAPCPYDVLTIGVSVPKDELRERYAVRARTWLTDGFVDEVKGLLDTGVSRDRIRELGFEYSLMLDLIDGKLNEDEYITAFVQKNWQYAKRQLTWLKRDETIEWYSPTDREAVVAQVQEWVTN